MKKYILSAALVLVILSASLYFVLSDEYRIDIKNTYTSFKVYENGSWELAGEERSLLYDGTTKMRAINGRKVNFTIEDNLTTAYRYAYFKNNITVIDKYVFNSSTDDVELFPVSHEITVLNAERERHYILVYEVSKLEYFGETTKDLGSAHEFGHNMKVEWEDGNYYERIYKYKDKNEGKLEIKYRIDSNNFTKKVRLFDPIISADSVFTNLIYNEADIDKGIAIFEIKNPVDNLSIDDLYYTYDVVKGSGLKSIEMYVEQIDSVQIPTYNFSVNQYSCEIYDNVTKKNQTSICNKTIQTQNGTIETLEYAWEKIDYLNKGFHKIKIIGYFEEIGDNSLDWYPNIVLDKNKYELPKDKFGKIETLNFKQNKWAWWNTSWEHYKEYTNLTGNITYMFIDAAPSDESDFNSTRFISCYDDSLVFNHTLEAIFGTDGQFRVNNLAENCTRRYYDNSAASSTSSASNVYFEPTNAYYFDANANDFIESDDGTVNGASLSSGYINGSYDFESTESDYISYSTLLDTVPTDGTLSIWINKESNLNYMRLYSKHSGNSPLNLMVLQNFGTTNELRLRSYDGGTLVDLRTGTIISTGTWYLITITWGSNGMKMYVDDTEVDSDPSTQKLLGDGTLYDFVLGKYVYNGASDSYYDGDLDELLIYDYALSLVQIKKIYTQTAPNVIEGVEQNQTPEDTCTYTSGNWNVDCSDNCSITSNVNLGGNNLSLYGTGHFSLQANISNIDKRFLINGCEIWQTQNSRFLYS